MNYGFVKVAAGSPKIAVADVDANVRSILDLIERAHAEKVNLLVLPELCITGCTCGDLFYSNTLLSAAKNALIEITQTTAGRFPVVVVGLPLSNGGRLMNCAAVIHDGEILGIVPKTNIPAGQRQFVSAGSPDDLMDLDIDGEWIPFSTDLLFNCDSMPDFTFGVELGEDLWAPDSPSTVLCLKGATIIANPGANEVTVGKSAYNRALVQSASSRMVCGYVSANPESGESTQDLVFGNHNIICENGTLLAENPPFGSETMICTEIDVQKLNIERRKTTWYRAGLSDSNIRSFNQDCGEIALTRSYLQMPFLPTCEADYPARCEEILQIQSHGLKKRLEHTHVQTAVVGISGGLDSCLALLVMARTMDLLKRDRKDIIAISMPCFGTTSRTRSNAEKLCEQLGVTFREINIAAAVRQHFADIGHDESVRNVTYENSQARERTKVIMDVANDANGLVVGTGDLSELALGWATYNGDHMSMYGVNAGIPKTLIRYVVRYEADRSNPELAAILYDILDTPVSPELLPASSEGEIQQKTEDLVGPYELHDFFLFHWMRYGFSPKKIYHLARHTFEGSYSNETILKWLRTFFRRFFMQQFKRSCLPDGPKVGTVSLSPRGDWQMPSDACSTLWLKEIDELKP